MTRPRRFVLLDRDGTIIVERNYLADPDGVELLPGAARGLLELRALGLGLAVVTNQSGVGRGYFGLDRVAAVHARMAELLAAEGVTLDGVFVCPHQPADACRCRKPAPGLVEEASAALGFAPTSAFMIGDKRCDIELAERVGAESILVLTGYGRTERESGQSHPAHVVGDLSGAAAVIQRRLVGGGR